MVTNGTKDLKSYSGEGAIKCKPPRNSKAEFEGSRRYHMLLDGLVAESHGARQPTETEMEAILCELLKSTDFAAFLASPEGSFPIATIPQRLRVEFPKCRLLVLTERIARKIAEKHTDVSPKSFQKLPHILLRGEMFGDRDSNESIRILFHKFKQRWWRLVVWFSEDGPSAQIMTFHRSTERAYRKASAGRTLADQQIQV